MHHTRSRIITARLQAITCLSLSHLLNLLPVRESSAASHKCHFRVRHFGRRPEAKSFLYVIGARSDSWPVQIHRTSAAGCTSDAAEEASRTAATSSGRQPIPSHLHHHFGACQSVTFGAHVRLVSGSDVPPCWMYPGAVRAPLGVVFAAWRR